MIKQIVDKTAKISSVNITLFGLLQRTQVDTATWQISTCHLILETKQAQFIQCNASPEPNDIQANFSIGVEV